MDRSISHRRSASAAATRSCRCTGPSFQWRTQWVAWIGPGLPTNLAQNSITTLDKLAQMLSFVSAQAEDTANPRALQKNYAPERDRSGDLLSQAAARLPVQLQKFVG